MLSAISIVLYLELVLCRQITLCIDCCHAARAGGRHGLAVLVVLHVSTCKNTGDACFRPTMGDQVSVCVHVELPAEQARVRGVADGNEDALDRQHALVPGANIPQPDAFDLLGAQDVAHCGVPDEVDLLVAEGTVLHDPRRPEFLAAVDDRHRPAEFREEEGLLEGGVAPADDSDGFVTEEEPVAGGTRRHPVTDEARFVGQAE